MRIVHDTTKSCGDVLRSVADWDSVHENIDAAMPAAVASKPYVIPGISIINSVSSGLVAGVIYYYPIAISRTCNINSASFEVTTASVPGGTARVAIYHCNSDLQPTTLIQDFGTVAIDSIGVKTYIVNVTLTPGCYLVAFSYSHDVTIRRYSSIHINACVVPWFGANAMLTDFRVLSPYAPYPSIGIPWDLAGGYPSGGRHIIGFKYTFP